MIFGKLIAGFGVKKSVRKIELKRSYYYSSAVSLVPVILIGMQSVGSVGFYDILLVVTFAIFACFYIMKRT